MDISELWLRSYADPAIDGAELADRLTMAGLEVEERRPVAPPFSGVVVAEVRSVARHPNADKLTICEVDAGQAALLQIVCGAPNVAPGIRVPCALPGATLPGGVHIKATTMRGVESQGMLCSARELGLSDEHSGLLLLPSQAPIGTDVRAALALDDHILTIKLTPNRADCLSVVGVAREVAAVTGRSAAGAAVRAGSRHDRRSPAGDRRSGRSVRTLLRAGHPQRRRAGGNAGVDAAAAVAQRAATDIRSGRYLELRDA